MTAAKAKKRIGELRELLHAANHAYYVDAELIMPDSEFDALLHELIELETAHPELDDPNSPTRRVGGQPIEGFTTIAHAVPMLSIDNTFAVDDLRAWRDRVIKGLGKDDQSGDLFGGGDDPVYVCDPKIDGVAISLRYEDGQLAHAVTRGDGRKGDDVTVQIRTIASVPLTLRPRKGGSVPSLLEVRGEVFIPNSEFQRINAEREAAEENLFANARNATAGTLKSLDPKIVARRKLSFIAHGRGAVRDMDDVPSHWAFLDRCQQLGLPVSPLRRRCETIDEVVETIERFAGERGGLDYGVDGIVVRVDQFDQQEQLGATSKAPRWCIAYKYPAERGTTRLLRVDWQVGKGGTLTPRATMEPIFIAGTTVQHATLHNIEEIRRKDIRVGDVVIIEKAGEIIPQVVEAVTAQRAASARHIQPPKSCPACRGSVEQEGPKLYCTNPECPAQFREKLKWFVGRNQMDIDGLGEKLIDQLVDEGLVAHFADVFTLQRDALLELDRMGEKSADNLVVAINEAKTRGLHRVLAGLGIRHIGTAAARTLAQHFADVDALLDATAEEIAELPDFGDITARALHEYLHSAKGRDVFKRLGAVGVDLTSFIHGEQGEAAADSPVAGKRIVITGTLESLSRTELTEQLQALGATVTGSVSKKTDLVIVGANPGSKADKARQLGIMVWGEDEVLKALS